jgi:hypothetical protein
MTTSHPERFRLEICRAGESFETHGFFESIDLARQAAEGDVVGCGDGMLSSWMGPETADHWIATAQETTYRITHEFQPVTTEPQYQALYTVRPHTPLTDEQLRGAVSMGLEASPMTAPLHIEIDVMDHRVFLNGRVHDQGEVRIVEQAVGRVSDVGEVVDLLDVEQS